MMHRLHNLSIRRKLIALLLLTNFIVLALVASAFVVNEATMFRTGARAELAACTAARPSSWTARESGPS